jgi:hypothetical protein
VPSLFSGPAIGFWQALGLLVLSKILLRGLRGGMGAPALARAHDGSLEAHMSEEEREKFRHGMGRCGRSASTPQPTP